MKLITFQPNIQSDILRQQKCCIGPEYTSCSC